MFGLESFYLAGSPSRGCSETIIISSSTNGGPPNPASVRAPFTVDGGLGPVPIVFDPPCFATIITITAALSQQGCTYTYTDIALDDIVVCPFNTTIF